MLITVLIIADYFKSCLEGNFNQSVSLKYRKSCLSRLSFLKRINKMVLHEAEHICHHSYSYKYLII